jgi:hypothetical protein
MKNTVTGIVIAIAAAVLAAVGIHFLRAQQASPPRQMSATAERPATDGEPVIEHPIEKAQASATAPQTPLPPVDASDPSLQGALVELFGQVPLDALFNLKDAVRRVVATIDNLPRESVAPRLMIARPTPGSFAVAGTADDLTLAPENYSRYTPFMEFVATVDAKKLVAAYVRFYPLFQKAYQDLGYPHGYFNDRLVAVIDHLLAAPDVSGPVKLVRSPQSPSIYQFADPGLEAKSAGRKILIRMGSDNAAIVKAKLREIRSVLTGESELRR